jgi:ubiquinone biosynthesis protein UbiJ
MSIIDEMGEAALLQVEGNRQFALALGRLARAVTQRIGRLFARRLADVPGEQTGR